MDQQEQLERPDAAATQDEQDDDGGFDAGFGAGDHPTETPGARDDGAAAQASADQAATGEQPGATDAPQAPAAPAGPPRYRQITEDEYTALMQRVQGIDELRAAHRRELDTAFGKVGRIEQQLQALAGAGVGEVTADDFAELHQEFPELAELQLKGLNRALSKVKGAPGAGGIDDARIQEALRPHVQQLGRATLEALHPDLPEIERSPEFAAFQAGLAPEVRQRLETDLNVGFVSSVVSQFKASRRSAAPAPAPASDPRRARLAQAVTPRGAAARPSAPSDDDAFEQGFSG